MHRSNIHPAALASVFVLNSNVNPQPGCILPLRGWESVNALLDIVLFCVLLPRARRGGDHVDCIQHFIKLVPVMFVYSLGKDSPTFLSGELPQQQAVSIGLLQDNTQTCVASSFP